MSAAYWTEVTKKLASDPETGKALTDAGLTVVRRGPVTHNTVFLEVSDPGADPELEGRTVFLVLEQYASTPDTGDAPTMDSVVYKTRIRERLVLA